MDKKLLTPGPLTTSMSTKEAMLHDWGSRDQKFIDLNQSIRDSLIKLIDGEGGSTLNSRDIIIHISTPERRIEFCKWSSIFSSFTSHSCISL